MSLRSSLLCSAASLLLGLALVPPALSQSTPPAWSRATSLGVRGPYIGPSVVDAAGNTYELNAFLTSTQVAGTPLTSRGGADIFLAKYAPTGSLAWVRQIGGVGDESVGGLTLDAAGNVYVAGTFSGSSNLGNGLQLDGGSGLNIRWFAARYTPQGTPEWVQQSSASAIERVAGGGIGLDATGTVYVTGLALSSVVLGTTTLSNSANAPMAFLAKLNGSSGALVSLTQAFTYAPPGNGLFYPPQIAVTPTGDTYLINQFEEAVVFGNTTLTNQGSQNALVARYNSAGAFDWVRRLGNTDYAFINGARTDAAGNLYVAGSISAPTLFGTTPVPHQAGSDGFVLLCNAAGSPLWVRTLAGAGTDVLSDVTVDAAANAYVVGTFSATAQLGPTGLTSSGDADVTVASFTALGQLRWVQQAGGPGNDLGGRLGLDGAGNVSVLGSFSTAARFTPFTLTAATAVPEGFLARLGNAPLATRPALAAESLALYPTPATDQLHLPRLPAGTPVQLLDALGRVARTVPVAAGTVSVQGLPAGLYQVRALDTQGRLCTGRVLVQ